MKTYLIVALILGSLIQSPCNGQSVSQRERADITGAVDKLCGWTGLRRQESLEAIKRFPRDENSRFQAQIRLIVDGSVTRYLIRFDSKLNVTHFFPEHFDWGDVGLGYDTLKDTRCRGVCLAAVTRVNRLLEWRWKSAPEMQKVGNNFVVTFETASRREQETASLPLDAYVSFLVTPKGTVFAGFWGG